MRMPVTIHFHHNETPLSAASRLAAANGYISLSQFLQHIGLKASAVEVGDPAATHRLSELSGIPSTQLGRYANTSVRSGISLIGAAKTWNVHRGRFWYCPCCVVADLATGIGTPLSRPYFRYDWTAFGVSHCALHKVSLHVGKRDGEVDFTRFVEKYNIEIREAAAQAVQHDVPSVEAYILQRIAGSAANPFLDQYELYVLYDLFHHLGYFLDKRGPPAPGMTAVERGYSVAKNGRDAIDVAVVEAISHARPGILIRGFIGPLVDRLKFRGNDPAYEEMLDVLQEILVSRLPFGTDQTIFKPVKRRVLHTLASASQEYGVVISRVSSTLVAAGIMKEAPGPNPDFWFDAEMVRPLFQTVLDSLSDTQVAKMLGVPIQYAVYLRRSGFLQTHDIQWGKGERTRILLTAVEALKESLVAHACRKPVGSHTVPLLKFLPRELPVLLRLANDGALKTLIAGDDSRLLSSYYVDVAEVKALLKRADNNEPPRGADGSDLLRIPDVALALGVGKKVVVELIKSGRLAHEPWPHKTGGHRPPGVSSKAVSSFQNAHVRLSEIAFRLGVKKREAFAMLEAKSIFSRTETPSLSSKYYCRSEVERLLRDAESSGL